jgi:ABC-type dipeptide/oligopeptide/nickel transport system permease component
MMYFVRRVLFLIATLWAAITLNFLIPRMEPGDPAQAMVSRLAGESKAINPATVHAIQIMLGAPSGNLLDQYFQYLHNLMVGNFGISFTYFPYSVTHMVLQAMPWTLVLVGTTQLISFTFGTVVGALAASKRNTWFDSVTTLGFTFTGTLPFFWIAMMLLFVFAFILHWFPVSGGYGETAVPGLTPSFLADAAYHSILPALAILITSPGGWIMGMRNNMIQTLGEDYTRLARAMGLKPRKIALSYGARNAILPNVTGFAMALGGILGGVVLVETVFDYPGMGRLLFESVGNHDYPLMQTIFLFTTVGVLLANFLADMMYGWLDPRVRSGGGS